MPRLFIAIDLPAAQAEALAALRDEALPARWTRPTQFHLTLRFVGEVDEGVAARLEAALAEVAAAPVALRVEGLGAFPSVRRPRVLFAALAEAPGLVLLQAEVEAAVQRLGLPADPKPFRPHVTLARIKGARPRAVREFLKTHADLALPPFEAGAFVLYESHLGPSGAAHRVRATYALDG